MRRMRWEARRTKDDDERETKTRETHKAKVSLREKVEFRASVEFILHQCFGVVFDRGRIICVG